MHSDEFGVVGVRCRRCVVVVVALSLSRCRRRRRRRRRCVVVVVAVMLSLCGRGRCLSLFVVVCYGGKSFRVQCSGVVLYDGGGASCGRRQRCRSMSCCRSSCSCSCSCCSCCSSSRSSSPGHFLRFGLLVVLLVVVVVVVEGVEVLWQVPDQLAICILKRKARHTMCLSYQSVKSQLVFGLRWCFFRIHCG